MDHSSTLPQHPSSQDRTAWAGYWQEQGQPWRTEPEIDEERQQYLVKLRAIAPDIEKDIYPFKGVKLSRADVEWLIAIHEDDCEPGKSSDEKQRERAGLDMRGADLREVDLSSLPLARLLGGEILSQAWLPAEHAQRYPASIHLEEANLHGVHLEGANLTYAHLEGANLYRAHLEEADLHYARLEGARLIEAHLEKVQFYRAHLEDADLLEAHLDGADLTRAFLNGATRLRKVTLGNKQQGVVSVAGVHWNDADLSVVDWTQVRVLGDETEAHQPTTGQGKKKTGGQRLEEYQITVQAYRRLALALQAQGLTEQGTRFAYRAQKLERVVFRRQGRVFSYLFSWFLYLLAGYGYKPARSFLAYLLIIGTFTIIYSALGPHLSWNEALVISMTAFHGRGFFPGTFSPGDPLALASAMEAFVGLIIEVTLIATLTQRFFGK